jgi:hypothetical protein
MMTKTMTTLRSIISPFIAVHLLLYGLLFVSKAAFLNAQIAFVSAFLILLGSMYSYRKLVLRNLENETQMHQDDLVDRIDDPYDVYGEDETAEEETRPLREVILEEKARLKTKKATVRNVSKSTPALMSIYRLVPYGILVLGFMALKNNHILLLWFFLPGLAAGIAAGFMSGKALFAER